MHQNPNKLDAFWPDRLIKNVNYLQSQVKIDMVSCMLWQNSNDWHVTPNPRTVKTYFMLMPTRGKVIVTTGEKSYTIEKGKFLLLPPNIIHTLDADPNFGDLEQISLHCHISDASFLPLNINELPVIHEMKYADAIIDKWLDLVFQINFDFAWGYRTGEVFVKQILEEILKNNPQFQFPPIVIDERMKTAVLLIHQKYGSDISIEEIAAHVGLKPVQFRNCFQKALGVTPKLYLDQLRLKHACDMLLHGNKSIKEISALCGFAKHDYFHKCFKSRYKCTPVEFRQNISNII